MTADRYGIVEARSLFSTTEGRREIADAVARACGWEYRGTTRGCMRHWRRRTGSGWQHTYGSRINYLGGDWRLAKEMADALRANDEYLEITFYSGGSIEVLAHDRILPVRAQTISEALCLAMAAVGLLWREPLS